MLPLVSWEKPTALQVAPVVHQVEVKSAPDAPGGLGVVWIDHVEPPFQTSTKVPPEGPLAPPTAVHSVEELHETPARWVFVAPAGFGGSCMSHWVPVSRSANAKVIDVLSVHDPTAVQAVLEVHDTASSVLRVALAGDGTVMRVHFVPFQLSPIGLGPEPLLYVPTAMQALSAGHDTP